jgi:hypothetical protein
MVTRLYGIPYEKNYVCPPCQSFCARAGVGGPVRGSSPLQSCNHRRSRASAATAPDCPLPPKMERGNVSAAAWPPAATGIPLGVGATASTARLRFGRKQGTHEEIFPGRNGPTRRAVAIPIAHHGGHYGPEIFIQKGTFSLPNTSSMPSGRQRSSRRREAAAQAVARHSTSPEHQPFPPPRFFVSSRRPFHPISMVDTAWRKHKLGFLSKRARRRSLVGSIDSVQHLSEGGTKIG